MHQAVSSTWPAAPVAACNAATPLTGASPCQLNSVLHRQCALLLRLASPAICTSIQPCGPGSNSHRSSRTPQRWSHACCPIDPGLATSPVTGRAVPGCPHHPSIKAKTPPNHGAHPSAPSISCACQVAAWGAMFIASVTAKCCGNKCLTAFENEVTVSGSRPRHSRCAAKCRWPGRSSSNVSWERCRIAAGVSGVM